MEKTTARIITATVLIGGLLVVGYAWYKAHERAKPQEMRRANVYDAAVPSSYTGPLDARLIVLTPEVLASAPDADAFTSPLGGEWGAFTYDAQSFGTENTQRGGKHYGQDLNGIGGMNTDEGDPVYAAGRGKVVYCGEPSPDWGNVIVLLHRLPEDGSFLQTLYAHLGKINVRYGELVSRGKIIGEVGTAGGRYPAHLHFEMIRSIGNEAGLSAYGPDTANRIDPAEFFKKYPPSDETLMPDILEAVQEMQRRHDASRIRFIIEK